MMKSAKDPVCGEMVDPKTTTFVSEYRGRTYYFCAPWCKKAFAREPEKYTSRVQQIEHHGHIHHHE
jgi:YHS domain-containing protein